MERWIEECREILERSTTGALPLSALKEELARAGIRVGSRERWLLSALEGRNDLFQIVRMARGAWAPDPAISVEIPVLEDPWIALRKSVPSAPGPCQPLLSGLRESIQAWGRCLDDGSPSGVARWIRANEEGTSTSRVLFRIPLRCE